MTNEWISVKDKLPEYDPNESVVVIVSGIDAGKRYVHYADVHAYGKKETSDEIFSIPGWSQMNVTHWMPLPEPPKEECKRPDHIQKLADEFADLYIPKEQLKLCEICGRKNCINNKTCINCGCQF